MIPNMYIHTTPLWFWEYIAPPEPLPPFRGVISTGIYYDEFGRRDMTTDPVITTDHLRNNVVSLVQPLRAPRSSNIDNPPSPALMIFSTREPRAIHQTMMEIRLRMSYTIRKSIALNDTERQLMEIADMVWHDEHEENMLELCGEWLETLLRLLEKET